MVNTPNDRVLLECKLSDNLDQRVALRKQVPASVMVWAVVTATERSPLEINIRFNKFRHLLIKPKKPYVIFFKKKFQASFLHKNSYHVLLNQTN